MNRGVAGQLAPARSSRAAPRREARATFMKRSGVAALSPEPKHRVRPLGGGFYEVATTTTVVRTLTEAEMRKLGIPVPGPDVPWEPERPEQAPPRRQYRTDSPLGQAMAYWRAHLGSGYDSRLPKQLPAWIDEFGLERVLRAMDEVRAQDSREPKYVRLVHVLRRMRDEKDGAR